MGTYDHDNQLSDIVRDWLNFNLAVTAKAVQEQFENEGSPEYPPVTDYIEGF